jgi:hypothetical protein
MTTITVPRAVLEQALEALEPMQNNRDDTAIQRAITALRAALVQQEQEPPTQAGALHAMKTVLWKQEPVVFTVTKLGALLEWEPTTGAFALPDGKHFLYTTPPRREWQSLTMQEINALPEVGGRMWNMGVAEAVLQAIRARENK